MDESGWIDGMFGWVEMSNGFFRALGVSSGKSWSSGKSAFDSWVTLNVFVASCTSSGRSIAFDVSMDVCQLAGCQLKR